MKPTNFRDWLDAGPAAMLRAANTPVSTEDPFAEPVSLVVPLRATHAPATDAAEALLSELVDAGAPADLHARLVHFLGFGAAPSARLWQLACRAYAELVEAHWAELGRFHASNGRPCHAAECAELREELMQIAAWEMPATKDEAIAAE